MSATIAPDRILHELAELWVSQGKQEGAAEAGVLRACAMTLVVLADASENPNDVGETLASLMRDHPSRAIVVRVSGDEKPDLEARVFTQCWMPFGQRRQICCEQIEITSSNISLPEVPAVVLPLVVADLPVILWSRLPRLFGTPAHTELSRIATKTIVDSASVPGPSDSLRKLAAASASGRILGDLAWTRLTRWRDLIAQLFENRRYACDIPSITDVTVAHTGASPTTGALYAAAWLRACLEQAGARPQVRLEPSNEPGDGGISHIHLACADPSRLRVSVHKLDGPAAEVTVDGLKIRTAFSETSDYSLLREELSIVGRDLIYEATLAIAARGEQ